MSTSSLRRFWTGGDIWLWLMAASLTLLLLMTVVFFGIIVVNGLQALWPRQIAVLTTVAGDTYAGAIIQRQKTQMQVKVANRDLNAQDFIWLDRSDIATIHYPEHIYVLERTEYGDFYGFLAANSSDIATYFKTGKLPPRFKQLQADIVAVQEQTGILNERISKLEKQRMERNDTSKSSWGEQGEVSTRKQTSQPLQSEGMRGQLTAQYQILNDLQTELDTYQAKFTAVPSATVSIALSDLVRYYQPNAMHGLAKFWLYCQKVFELLTAEPREANTEGGVFPAAFGTVLLVFLMSITSFPFGVLAGIYLGLYARDGLLLRVIRIAVHNLAGIPSIVFGIFGLGFFVYGLGASIDQLFYASALPAPTFGTGGILWASLTLGILTLPVVVVATEEALRTVPKSLQDSSMALGATRLQTLTKVLLPAASPSILTGFILAMARAAGEVAPLMITGVVKLAPHLAIDGSFPFLHLERKFMHLGFHIYDISYQSPNVDASRPLVYATTLLLLFIVVLMAGSSIWLRARLRKKYKLGAL
ncbi:MAG: phosphate ABC transporter permease PstA [Pseudomonadota bacterium]|nr:phosphate ABC transporter permease PstA [Pseudomonadota bacterium]